jgi:hypothetical protein
MNKTPLFQMNWLRQLIRSIVDRYFSEKITVNKTVIDLNIIPNEVLVRGIVAPLWASSSKSTLKANAFLPPRESSLVSLNRLRYCSASFCKNHAKKLQIEGNQYVGLAIFNQQIIQELNEELEVINFAFVVASPIDSQNEYINTTLNTVYAEDAGTPMHADLTYSVPNSKIQVHSPAIDHLQYAKKLIKKVKYLPDTDVTNEEWIGEELNY